MIELVEHTAESSPRGKADADDELPEGFDARKARAARARLEMLLPEHVGTPRLAGRIALGRVAQDLRCVLEWNAGDEPGEKSLEESQPRFSAREIEGFEDLVDGKHSGSVTNDQ
jgi:hypothetical protein